MSAQTWAAITALVVATVATTTAVQAQGEIFERGNQLYQQEDYQAAAEAYEAVLAAGFESAELHYNLGNAWFKSGDLGRSKQARDRSVANRDTVLQNEITAHGLQQEAALWQHAHAGNLESITALHQQDVVLRAVGESVEVPAPRHHRGPRQCDQLFTFTRDQVTHRRLSLRNLAQARSPECDRSAAE